MYFAEIAVLPAILFSPKIKVATRKTVIYSTVRVHFRKFRWQSNGFCIRLVSIESIEPDIAVILGICGCIKPFCIMSTALFWCAYTAREILEYLPITLSWFAAKLFQCLDKMVDVNSMVNSEDLIKNALFMPRLAICSRDLHWHWINWTLLCDTMEVSMLRLAWLTTAQHVFQPALTGRLELVSRKTFLPRTENKGNRGEQISQKIVSWKLGPRGYRDLVKNIAFLGAKKWGPTCDRDISNSAIYTTAIYREYPVFSW